MTIKSDKWITEQCNGSDHPMITPFFLGSVATLTSGKKVPSFGLSSYGYDVRLGKNFKIFATADSLSTSMGTWAAYRHQSNADGALTSVQSVVAPILPSHEVDPCNFAEVISTDIDNADELVMPPLSFCLAVSMERIKVPRDVSVVCMGKSTIARSGIIVIVTPLEAEWEGYITLEITNTTRMPVRLTAGMGITQLQFFQSDEQCLVSYKDRSGKYQDQPAKAVVPLQL